jgi:hypothetical protein
MTNEIRWIDRDKDGKICSHYANKQREGQEYLPEDHPELLAFAEAQKQAQDEVQAAQIAQAEWLKTAKAEMDALKTQKADKSTVDATTLSLEERILQLEVFTKILKVPK